MHVDIYPAGSLSAREMSRRRRLPPAYHSGPAEVKIRTRCVHFQQMPSGSFSARNRTVAKEKKTLQRVTGLWYTGGLDLPGSALAQLS